MTYHGVGSIVLLCVYVRLSSYHLENLGVLIPVCVDMRVGVHREVWVRYCVCVVQKGKLEKDQHGNRLCVCDESCIRVGHRMY